MAKEQELQLVLELAQEQEPVQVQEPVVDQG